MRTVLTLLLVSYLATASAIAQSATGFGGFFRGGYVNLAASGDLLQQVSPGQEASRQSGYGAAGCELFFRSQKLMVTVSVLGMGRKFRTPTGTPYDLTGSTRHLKLGWIIHQTPRAVVYPSLGPGLSTLSLAYRDGGTSRLVHTLYYTTDVGLHADFTLNNPEVRKGAERLLLGLRLGGFIGQRSLVSPGAGIKTGSWPGVGRPSGWYATLTLGGGAFFFRNR